MMILGTAQISSTAAPAAFFARWADTATWPRWSHDTAWVRLDGPFAEGATGVLKPKGGPRTRFVVTTLTDREFTDVSLLPGAELTFRHLVDVDGSGATVVTVTASLAGPLARLWRKILGRGIATTVPRDLAGLKAAAEAAHPANARVAA
ncbi:SRPBCC family protein [Kitasatospora sp. NPDC094028]